MDMNAHSLAHATSRAAWELECTQGDAWALRSGGWQAAWRPCSAIRASTALNSDGDCCTWHPSEGAAARTTERGCLTPRHSTSATASTPVHSTKKGAQEHPRSLLTHLEPPHSIIRVHEHAAWATPCPCLPTCAIIDRHTQAAQALRGTRNSRVGVPLFFSAYSMVMLLLQGHPAEAG